MSHRHGHERSTTVIRRPGHLRVPEDPESAQFKHREGRLPPQEMLLDDEGGSDPEERPLDEFITEQRADAGWGGERDYTYPWGAFGRHRRGFNSQGMFDPAYGQSLGRGNWRSGSDEGEDRSGRAGFGYEDVENEVERETRPEMSAREDLGLDGGPDTGLAGSGVWAPAPENSTFAGRGPRKYQRRDARILEEIAETFTDHDELDATHIDIVVAGGEVTLQGSVTDRLQKRLAEDLADAARGVTDVHNRLKVSAPR